MSMFKKSPVLGGIVMAMALSAAPAYALNFSVEHVLTDPVVPAGPSVKFGWASDLDGDTAVVGDYTQDLVHVYERQIDGSWQHHQTINAPTGPLLPAVDRFGHEVALDGDSLAISDPWADGLSDTRNDAGVVHIYSRQADGNWSRQQTLGTGSGTTSPEYNHFGTALDMQDGILVVGSPDDEVDASVGSTAFKRGSAEIFKRDATGSWSFHKYLIAATPLDESYLGTSVETDGTRVVVGAKQAREDATTSTVSDRDVGLAYIYGVETNEVSLIRAPAAERIPGDKFGAGVEIFGDYAFAGAPGFDSPADAAGKVYAFHYNTGNSSWEPLADLSWVDLVRLDGFGWSIDFDGTDLVVGATNYVDTLYYFTFDTLSNQFTPVRSWQAANPDGSLGMDQVRISGDGVVLASSTWSDEVMIFEPESELSLVVQDDTDPITKDTEFGYTIMVTNVDTEVTATGISVSGTLPDGFTLVQNDTACTTSTTVSITCDIASLAPGKMQSFEIRVSAATDGSYTFTPELVANEWLVNGPVISDSETTVIGEPAPAASTESSGGGGALSWSLLLLSLFGLLRIRTRMTQNFLKLS